MAENLFGLDANLPVPNSKQGTFCEVGAFDGVYASNTFAFEQVGWNGICVEADPASAGQCRENRICDVWCCAVGLKTHGKFRLNLIDPALSGLEASANYGPLEDLPVLIKRLDWLLVASGIEELDLLSIDTEGTELEVWESIGVIRPRVVVMEHLTGAGPSRAREIEERLARDGYRVVHQTQCNLILIREDRMTG